MESSQRINLRLESQIYKNIESVLGEETMSDFIRKAIKNELIGRDNLVSDNQKILSKLDELDTTSLQEKYTKAEITLQILFEEQQKLIEVIKILFVSSQIILKYTQEMYTDAHSPEMKEEIISKIRNRSNDILEQVNFLKGSN